MIRGESTEFQEGWMSAELVINAIGLSEAEDLAGRLVTDDYARGFYAHIGRARLGCAGPLPGDKLGEATRDRDRFARTVEYRVRELDEARAKLAAIREITSDRKQ